MTSPRPAAAALVAALLAVPSCAPVNQQPKGAPGSRHWTEVWLVAMKDKNVPVKLSFKESGMNAADFEIR